MAPISIEQVALDAIKKGTYIGTQFNTNSDWIAVTQNSPSRSIMKTLQLLWWLESLLRSHFLASNGSGAKMIQITAISGTVLHRQSTSSVVVSVFISFMQLTIQTCAQSVTGHVWGSLHN